jgi:hypothetical protein
MLASAVRLAMDSVWPATIVTCSSEGIPNVATLSQVWYVDDWHVALSNQYFNKTKTNLATNPNAIVFVISQEADMWDINVRYLRTETSGATFNQMALKLEAIASFMGMEEVFQLRGADIYEVLEVCECKEHWDEGDCS